MNSVSPNGTLYMLGDIPENAGGTIWLGGEAHMWTGITGGKEKYFYPVGGYDSASGPTGAALVAEKGKPFDSGTGTKSRKLTLLKTNLKWNTTCEPISDNVLYDRYNYMVYKIRTTNESEGTSEIDFLEYFFTVHNQTDHNKEGITNVDLMQWIYDPVTKTTTKNTFGVANPGDPDSVTSATDKSQYIGVPNRGGVLLYNTTNWLQKDYDELDMRTFANIDSIIERADARPRVYTPSYDKSGKLIGYTLDYDTSTDSAHPIVDAKEDAEGKPIIEKAKSIPYQTNNQSGRVTFTIPGDQGGLLTPKTRLDKDAETPQNGEYTFIMAVPFTTNFNLTSGAYGEGYYAELASLTTIRFGKLGVEGDYSWSDSPTKFKYPFKQAEADFEAEKVALDNYEDVLNAGGKVTGVRPLTEPKEVTTTKHSYMGYPLSYEIKNFKTKGNMPLYGEDALSHTAGPDITDTLPNYFRLYNIELGVQTDEQFTDATSDADKLAPLQEYFNTNKADFKETLTNLPGGAVNDSSVVQFQVSAPSAEDENVDDYYWINAGQPTYVRDEPVKDLGGNVIGYKHIYRIGGTDKATSLASGFEKRGINPVPGISRQLRHEEDEILKFTGQVRVQLNTEMDPNVTLPISVKVNGSLTIPGYDYRNYSYVAFGKRTWNFAAQKYASSQEVSDESMAAFLQGIAPQPTLTANALSMATKLYDENAVLDPKDPKLADKQPILSRSGAGWRFSLNNRNYSMMDPAKITIGDMYMRNDEDGKPEAAGFNTDRIGLSEALLKNGDIKKITVYYRVPGSNGAITTKAAEWERGGTDGHDLEAMLDAHRVEGVNPDKSTYPNGVVLTPELWLGGYFSSLVIEFDTFKGMQEIATSDKMYIDILGTPEELDAMTLSGTFTTTYENYSSTFTGRNVKADASASFTSRKAPYNLQVVTQGMRESQVVGDPNALLGNWEYKRDDNGNIIYVNGVAQIEKDEVTQQNKLFEGYISDPGTGWRVNVSNDSRFAIGNAVIKGGVVLKQSQGQGKPVTNTETDDRKIPFWHNGRADYEAQALAISPALYDSWEDETDSAGNKIQATDENGDPVVDGSGNPVYNRILKGGVLSDLKLEYFDANNSSNEQAPKTLVIDGLLLRAATNTFTDADEELFASNPSARPTAAQVAEAGITVNDDGFVIITLANIKKAKNADGSANSGWKSNYYLRGFEQYFTDFGYGLKQSDNAYMDVYGLITNQDELHFGGVFSTAYPIARWDTATDSEGVLDGMPYPADGTPHHRRLCRHGRRQPGSGHGGPGVQVLRQVRHQRRRRPRCGLAHGREVPPGHRRRRGQRGRLHPAPEEGLLRLRERLPRHAGQRHQVRHDARFHHGHRRGAPRLHAR